MLPTIAREAMHIAQDPDADFNRLTVLIERDAAIAGRFISEANSSLYSFGAKVTNVQTALVRLGLGRACEILVLITSEPFIFTSVKFAAEMAILRNHSQAVAAAASYLAKVKPLPDREMGIAGIIHDIGAAALLTHIADHVVELAELDRDRNQLKLAIRMLRAQAGQVVAQRWKLPEPLVAAINHTKQAAPNQPIAWTIAAAHDAVERCKFPGFDAKATVTVESYLGNQAKATDAMKKINDMLADLLPMRERTRL